MPVLHSERENRGPLGIGTAVSLLAHLGLVVVALFAVRTVVVTPPPQPHNLILTLITQPPRPPPPLKPPPVPPPQLKPPPELAPVPQIRTPQAIVSRTLSARAVATAPPPPPPKLAPARPAARAPAPPHPESGVVGHHVSEDFRRKLEAEIKSHLRYPPMAARQGREGSAVVQVRMKRDGTILSVELRRSSGTESLDNEAQEVFHRIGTLPAMPPDFLPQASEFQFALSINFHLLGFGG